MSDNDLLGILENPLELKAKLNTLNPKDSEEFLNKLKSCSSKELLVNSVLFHTQKNLQIIKDSISKLDTMYKTINDRFFAQATEQEMTQLSEIKTKVRQAIENIQMLSTLLWGLGIDNSNIIKTLNSYKIKYIDFLVGIGDSYEAGIAIMKEGKQSSSIKEAIEYIPDVLENMDPENMLVYLAKVNTDIYENGFKSDTIKESNKQYISALNQQIFNKLVVYSKKAKDTKTGSRDFDRYLLEFAKLITGRQTDGKYKAFVETDFQDPKLANEVLLFLMNNKLGLVDDLILDGKIVVGDELIGNGQPYKYFESFISMIDNKLGKGIGQQLLNNTGFGDFEKIKGKKYNQIGIQERIKSSIMIRLITKLREKGNFTINDISQIFMEVGKQGFELVKKSIDKGLFQGFNIVGKKGKDFGLSGLKEEIFDLYSQIQGSGILNFSDETINYLKEGGKMAGVIGACILSGIAVGLTLPVSIPTLVGAAITGSVVGTVGTTASILVQGQGYDTKTDMIKDVGSQLAINIPMGAVGGAIGAKFTQSGMGILTKEGLRATGINAGLELGNMSSGIGTEWARQRYVMGNEIDFNQMFATGLIFSSAGLVASKFSGAKISHPNKENLDILGTTLIKSSSEDIHLYNKVLNGEQLSSQEKQIFVDTIVRNHPYVGVLRLNQGDTVRNFNFGGIKGLNDTIGQLDTDRIISIVQEKIIGNIDGLKLRKVRQEHKNLTLGGKSELSLDDFYIVATKGLQNLSDIPEIMEILQESAYKTMFLQKEKDGIIRYKKYQINKAELDNFIKDNPLEWESYKSNVKKSANQNKQFEMQLEKINEKLKGFKIVLGQTEVESDIDIDKLKAMMLAERAGVMADVQGKNYSKYDPDILISLREKTKQLEEKIFKFEDKIVQLNNGSKVKLVLHIDNGNGQTKLILNEDVIRAVRKGESIGDEEISQLVSEYIKTKNSYLDCIKAGTYDTLQQDFDNAQKYNEMIAKMLRNGEFEIEDSLLKSSMFSTQKGVMTRKHFEYIVSQKKSGTIVMSDIKDMFLSNLKDFSKIDENLIRPDGSIDYNLLLKAGDSVTQKFLNLVQSLKKQYGDDLLITLGGDEMYFYIPGEFDENSFKKFLVKEGLNGRVSFDRIDQKNVNDIKLRIDCLDKSCGIIKAVEEKLSSMKSLFNGFVNIGNLDISLKLGNVDGNTIKSDEQYIRKYLSQNTNFEEEFAQLIFGNGSGMKVHIGKNYYLYYDNAKGYCIEQLLEQIPVQTFPQTDSRLAA